MVKEFIIGEKVCVWDRQCVSKNMGIYMFIWERGVGYKETYIDRKNVGV